MSDPVEEHRRLQSEAVAADARAHHALLDDDRAAAQAAFTDAARLYRASWDAAPPNSFGRLVGLVKSATLAGDGAAAKDSARFVRDTIGPEPGSPTAAYAFALASLAVGDDALARSSAALMRPGGTAFTRAAAAIQAIADRNRDGYRAALQAIVDDFAERSEHLTGVAIADTAVVLERFAAARGLSSGVDSPLLPPA